MALSRHLEARDAKNETISDTKVALFDLRLTT
jgi:hypothetical protein